MRAPPESTSQTIGMRWRRQSSRRRAALTSPVGPMEPPKTVKSYEATPTARPSILPKPVTTASAGERTPGCLPRIPNSSKVPGSNRRSIRSRAVSLPRPCCFAIRSGPPMARASPLRFSRSSTSSRSFATAGSLSLLRGLTRQRCGRAARHDRLTALVGRHEVDLNEAVIPLLLELPHNALAHEGIPGEDLLHESNAELAQHAVAEPVREQSAREAHGQHAVGEDRRIARQLCRKDLVVVDWIEVSGATSVLDDLRAL